VRASNTYWPVSAVRTQPDAAALSTRPVGCRRSERQWGRTSIVRPHCRSTVALCGNSCPGTSRLAVSELDDQGHLDSGSRASRLPSRSSQLLLFTADRSPLLEAAAAPDAVTTAFPPVAGRCAGR